MPRAILIFTLIMVTAYYAQGLLLGSSIPHQVITNEMTVDWSATGGPEFDPWGKCPEDFFGAGFMVIYKKLADKVYYHYLYHRSKRLLYRIDVDEIDGIRRIGLHWVEGTRYGAKYRVADKAYVGGKSVDIPTRSGTTKETFHYGQPVSKRASRKNRELFDPTHTQPGQCPDWFDIFTLTP